MSKKWREKVHDMIRTTDSCYNMYMCDDFDSAINFAIDILKNNKKAVSLSEYDIKDLKEWLKEDFKEEFGD